MEYKEYIDLGFKRTDMSCSVEFRKTGYYGFSLERNLNKGQMLVVVSGELDKPRLYIKKRNSDTYHILPITEEVVKDLVKSNE